MGSMSYINMLLLLLISVPTSKCFSIFGQMTVHVQNDIEGDVPLGMHCRSKDDDLGKRTLYQ
ncbi:hypothetical protein MKX03_031990, partial [Papaver bracteatum]